MKKLIAWTSLILAASLYAETGDDKGQLKRSMKVVPLSSIYLSEENGGTKHASIVLADGVGIYTTQEDEYAKAISYLNGKYGEDALKDDKSLKQYVLDTGTESDKADKELAEKLVINTGGSVKEGECDDGKSNTIDTYIDGVCVSTPIKESIAIKCDEGYNPGDYVEDGDGVKYLVVDDTTIKTNLNRADTLCTSKVTDMNMLFYYNTSFNKDISKWDTSNVTNMSHMFNNAKAFDQPIENWDTSEVKNMSYMFHGATNFNQPLNWDTNNVIDMSYMFTGASSFNRPLNWVTSKVTDMTYMFNYAQAFNENISNWDTSKVKDMSYMFAYATKFNQDIENWKTGNVTDMNNMFSRATLFNKPLNWNTSNVTNMAYMFTLATSFNQDIGGWDTGNVTNMTGMFDTAKSFNQNISNWDTGKVKDNKYFAPNSALTGENSPF